MSPVLPFDVIVLIIDIIGETNDKNLLKKLSLVSLSFLQICRKHLFATVELHSINPHLVPSKKGFVKLLKSRSDVINCIRKLTYRVGNKKDSDDHLFSSMILSKFLPSVSRLNSLTIAASHYNRDWNTLDSSLTSAFLHLMHLPTINHIGLSLIVNFPVSSLTLSVNLLRLDLHNATLRTGGGDFGENPQSETFETMPKIREFHTSNSTDLTKKLLDAKRQDGRPAFNFMDLRRVSMSLDDFEDPGHQIIRYLLQNAKLLEKLRLKVDAGHSIVGILSSTESLKFLDLRVSLYYNGVGSLAGLCEELEAMSGHNMLEALSLEILLSAHHTMDFVGSKIQEVENVLAKPGWSALRQVSFKLRLTHWGGTEKLAEALQSLPDKYLSHLPKLEVFDYSVKREILY